MRNLPRHRDETRSRWRALLENLGRLDDHLATEYLERVEHGARYYDSVPDEQDLRDSARNAFQYLLATLLERPMGPDLAGFPTEVGALRARQGIALENLTVAVRTDFLVAWSALLQLAKASDMVVLALHVDVLWKAVDDFATLVQRGYLDQRLVMARASVLDQQQSLSELFADQGPGPAAVHRAAQVLGLDEKASYWVVGAGGEGDARTVARRLERRHAVPVEYLGAGVALLLVAADDRWESDDAVVADLLAGIDGAVAPRPMLLAEVFRAARAVRMLVALEGPATTLRRSWARLSIAQLATVIDELRGYVVAPLQAVGDGELILDTVLVFTENGSVSETAAVMYCHRNTVLNRIRKFEEATGVALRSPRSSAMVQLCLLPS